MPFVTCRAQDRSPCLGVVDLNGHDLSFCGFTDALPENVEKELSSYPNACYYVRSAMPAVFGLGGSKIRATVCAPFRFEGAAGFAIASPWDGTCIMTNVHSTATGTVSVASGTLAFNGGAGWAGESEVSISGTGKIEVNAGAWGFSGDRDGRKRRSMVTLSFPEEGKGRLVLNENCEVAELFVNGVEMPVGSYTKDSLSPYLEGEGTLHVCGKHPGVLLIVR